MDFKFLHAADIHLDSPLRGLARYEGVPAEVVRTATRTALDNLVERAIAEEVAFVILAGDLYDGTWEAFATGLYFCSAMGRLHKAGIEVYLVYGNHDAESHLTRDLPLPDNVRVFSKRQAETLVHTGTGVVLHGQSYKARDPGGDLAAHYPEAQAGAFNVGVLHTALTGDRGHAPYAPCTPDQLAAKGYDYWALGHVHAHDVVRRDPYIVFPGNLQGRNIRETGPKGAVLVSVTHGRVSALDHLELDVVRWAVGVADMAGAVTEAEAHERIRESLADVLENADGRPVMARVRLIGSTELHGLLSEGRNTLREAVRAIATALSDQIWIEKVVLATSEPARTIETGDEFDALLTTLSGDEDLAALLSKDLADFLTKAPADLDEDQELVAAAREGRLADVLSDAATALKARLHSEVEA